MPVGLHEAGVYLQAVCVHYFRVPGDFQVFPDCLNLAVLHQNVRLEALSVHAVMHCSVLDTKHIFALLYYVSDFTYFF